MLSDLISHSDTGIQQGDLLHAEGGKQDKEGSYICNSMGTYFNIITSGSYFVVLLSSGEKKERKENGGTHTERKQEKTGAAGSLRNVTPEGLCIGAATSRTQVEFYTRTQTLLESSVSEPGPNPDINNKPKAGPDPIFRFGFWLVVGSCWWSGRVAVVDSTNGGGRIGW